MKPWEKTFLLVVLVVVLVALVGLVTGFPPKDPGPRWSPLTPENALSVSAVPPPPVDPLVIPAEQPGWVQYETLAKGPGRPHLRIMGIKLARDPDHGNNIGLDIAFKNTGSVTCTLCWLMLSTKEPGQPLRERSEIKLVPMAEPLAPGEYRRRHWWVDESVNEQIEEWRLEFYSYLPYPS